MADLKVARRVVRWAAKLAEMRVLPLVERSDVWTVDSLVD